MTKDFPTMTFLSLRLHPLRACLIALVACGLVLPVRTLAASTPTAAPSQGSLYAGPCAAGNSSYYTLDLAPGSTYTNCLNVANTTTAPMPVTAYPVDGLTGVTSGAVYSNEGVALRSAGTWISMKQQSYTLPPGVRTKIYFTIHVPSNATPGDHLAGVAIQPSHTSTSKGSLSITIVNRLVIATVIVVPGPAAVRFAIDSAQIEELQATHSASITTGLSNTGQLYGKSTVTIRIHNATYDKTNTLKLDNILPGDTIPYPFRWPYSIPVGTYSVTVTVRWHSQGETGTPESTTRTFTSTVASALKATKQNVEYVPEGSTSGVPVWVWILIGGILLVIIAAAVVITILVRRQRNLKQELRLSKL